MFDKLDTFFCLDQLYSCEIKGKVYRLIHEMNKNGRVKVKTPVGMTQSKDIDPSITQGSVESSVISSAGIGKGVNDAFSDSDGIVMFEGIPLPQQSFMDDILKSSTDRKSAQNANDIMEDLMGKAGLELNIEKSSFIITGTKSARK